MLNITRIKPEVVKLYDKNNIFIAELNNEEFNDIRIQIGLGQYIGFYIIDKDNKKYNIQPDGACQYECFNTISQSLYILLKLKSKKVKDSASFRESYIRELYNKFIATYTILNKFKD